MTFSQGIPQIISVSALNRLARQAIEAALPLLWVRGEISNFVCAASGHLYFTLKDAQAQVRCAMWRTRAQLLHFRPCNGMTVEARVLLTLYEARGDYQLAVETLRPAGGGDLAEAFRRLKEKLAAEGLFARHRPLPLYPSGVGIITSPAAAALRDVLVSLRRRAPGLPVTIYPAAVQGMDAPRQLCEALARAARRARADGVEVVMLVRGGGSLEDLWAFNDETLARVVAAFALPVVSGIGHETDFTIADFAADLRAPTPTGAAELVSAGYFSARDALPATSRLLRQSIARQLEILALRLDRLRLIHPRDRLGRSRENLLHCEQRLRQIMTICLGEFSRTLSALKWRAPSMAVRRTHVQALGDRLNRVARQLIDVRYQKLAACDASLRQLNPQAVLARGYSIVRDARGFILRSTAELTPGDLLVVQLGEGSVDATVQRVRE